MTTAHVFIATSLDGYIARRNGDIEWLETVDTGTEDHGYEAFIAQMDGLIMGRGSYEKVRSFGQWPYSVPVVVLSSQLEATPVPDDLEGKVSFWNYPPEDCMARAAELGWRRVYVDGGKVIQSFLRAGQVADMIVTRLPVLLGEGLLLFGPTDKDIWLKHESTRSFPSGLTQSKYLVADR